MHKHVRTLLFSAIACSIALSINGCSLSTKKYSSAQETSGFLKNYQQLQTMPGQNNTRYYEKPNATWSQYKRIMIDPVRILSNQSHDKKTMSLRDRQMLARYFEIAMQNAVGLRYRIVQKPGPGVIRVRAAVTDAKSARSWFGSGLVSMEGEILDSTDNSRLIAIVDTKSAGVSGWDDMAKGYDRWAEQLLMVLERKLGDISDSDNLAIEESITTKEQQIKKLLQQASAALRANRLTTPVGMSAMDHYSTILSMDSMHQAALNGMEDIVKKYVFWGERAINDGRRARAWHYLDKARGILEDHEAVRRLENALYHPTAFSSPTPPSPVSVAPIITAAAIVTDAVDSDLIDETTQNNSLRDPKPAKIVADDTTFALTINTTPETATVSLLNTDIAYTPGVTLEAGTYEFEVSADGFESERQAVTLSTQDQSLTVQLLSEPKAFDPWLNSPASQITWQDPQRPFILGLESHGDNAQIVEAAKKRVIEAGFQIAGEYSPYDKTHVVVVTSDTLKQHAAKSEMGGYGAALRIAISTVGEIVQISYTNPVYMHHMYRLSGDILPTAKKLANALGGKKSFGSDDGIKSNDLRDWHYMFGMPYFDDPVKLSKSGSHQEAVRQIEQSLAKKTGGVSQVFKIDIPGKDETVFGVALTKGDGADHTVMQSIDSDSLKHAAHLPYEILVSGNKTYILNGKFRIAASFPDLTMGQFASIKDAPGDIEDALEDIAKGK
jgi:hypothetical protein